MFLCKWGLRKKELRDRVTSGKERLAKVGQIDWVSCKVKAGGGGQQDHSLTVSN